MRNSSPVLATALLPLFALALAAEDASPPARPGWRLDPALLDAATQFFGALPEGAKVEPGLTLSEAADGYTVTRYALVAGKKTLGRFFRVRTLVGTPGRDVVAKFAADGTLEDIFDLRPPSLEKPIPVPPLPPDEKGPTAPPPGKTPPPEVAKDAGRLVRPRRMPSDEGLMGLIGRHPATEGPGFAALTLGLARAETLVGKGKEEALSPLPAGIFEIRDPVPAVGTPMPAFSVRTLSGHTVDRASLAGKRALIVITALRLEVCAPVNDRLSRFLDEHPEAAKRVLWIFSDRKATARTLLAKVPFVGEAACDPLGALAEKLGTRMRPVVLFYERDGKLAGAVTPRTFEALGPGLENWVKK